MQTQSQQYMYIPKKLCDICNSGDQDYVFELDISRRPKQLRWLICELCKKEIENKDKFGKLVLFTDIKPKITRI